MLFATENEVVHYIKYLQAVEPDERAKKLFITADINICSLILKEQNKLTKNKQIKLNKNQCFFQESQCKSSKRVVRRILKKDQCYNIQILVQKFFAQCPDLFFAPKTNHLLVFRLFSIEGFISFF